MKVENTIITLTAVEASEMRGTKSGKEILESGEKLGNESVVVAAEIGSDLRNDILKLASDLKFEIVYQS